MEGSPIASTSRLSEDSIPVEPVQTPELSIQDAAGQSEAPVVRGRGRGRPRGSKARGRGRPRGKGLPKLNWQRPRPGDSSDDEVQFLAQHTVHPDKGTRASEPLTGGSDGAAPNSDAVPDVAAVSGKRSRSGRQIVKPAKIVPSTEPSFYRFGLRRTRAGRHTNENGESNICSICQQGHSPASNLLVTCDICEISFHQLCHTPAISDDIATDNGTTWFCSQCEAKRNVIAVPSKWEERVDGHGLPERDKLEYLQKLPHASLVTLLLDIESHMKDVRLYPTNLAAVLSDYRRALAAESEQITARRSALDSLLDEESRKQDDTATNGGDARISGGDRNKRPRLNPANTDLASGLAHLPDVSASANPYSDTARQPSGEHPRQASASAVSDALLDPALRSLIADNGGSTEVSGSAGQTTAASEGVRQATGYEEMAIEALEYINDPRGSYPRTLFQWMYDTYPVHESFRASAGQALNRAVKRGRLLKEGKLYRINPNFDDSVLSNKNPTRTLNFPTLNTRKVSGTKPREEYLKSGPRQAPAKNSDSTSSKDKDKSKDTPADQFDMLEEEEDDYLDADQLDKDSSDGDEEDGGVGVPDFVIPPHESESQEADMDSFLAEFMSASNEDHISAPAPGHEMDHLLDPSLFGTGNFHSSFYLGMSHPE